MKASRTIRCSPQISPGLKGHNRGRERVSAGREPDHHHHPLGLPVCIYSGHTPPQDLETHSSLGRGSKCFSSAHGPVPLVIIGCEFSFHNRPPGLRTPRCKPADTPLKSWSFSSYPILSFFEKFIEGNMNSSYPKGRMIFIYYFGAGLIIHAALLLRTCRYYVCKSQENGIPL